MGAKMGQLHSRGSPIQSLGRKLELAASAVPSRWPTRGLQCYITPAFSGVPNAKHGEKIRSGYFNPAFSRAQKRAEVLHNPCNLGGPQSQAGTLKLAASRVPFRWPTRGRKCYVTPAFSNVPNAKLREKRKSGYLTHAFSGARKRAEGLHNPCILRSPQRQALGEKQKWLPHTWLLGRPKEGGSAT